MKKCSKCGLTKSFSEFHRRNVGKGSYQPYCVVCKKANDAEYFKKNKDVIMAKRISTPEYKERQHANKYKITVEELRLLKSKHDGLCWICLYREGSCVDHCHTTDRVRGWLCNQCNTGIGLLGDNPDTLTAAATYLNGM